MDKLRMPGQLMKRWISDPQCSKEFKDYLDKFCVKYSVLEEGVVLNPDDPNKNSNKRVTGGGGATEESPLKKLKMNNSLVVLGSVIKAPLLFECKSSAKDGGYIQIRAGNVAVYNNKSNNEINMGSMESVASFGKGAFRITKGDENIPPEQVPFRLTSEADLVCLNGVVSTVGKVYFDQQKTKPGCQVCYHTTKINEEDTTKIQFTSTHKIGFLAAEADSQLSPANIASKLPYEVWSKSNAVTMVWHVRWTAKGLQPVKPALFTKGAVVVPAGSCCYLAGVPEEAPGES